MSAASSTTTSRLTPPGQHGAAIARWALLIALASCNDGGHTTLFPHKRLDVFDPAWNAVAPNLAYVEQACSPKPTEDTAQTCAMASAPSADATHSCTSTFEFQGIVGCCVLSSEPLMPDVVDRVLFFECP
jgi:hypothetical protein